ncbi:MAG: Abi family protein [Atopobiaceae bacterium]|nr:Abi family protein [Atopobiaceae bacterium]
MNKQFKTIQQQVELLEQRGVATDERTASTLQREGYYAVVNGYGKAFIDTVASAEAGDDRYRPGTTFDQIYQLFLFDRELRSITFMALMSVECTLRAIISYTFCAHHRRNGAYLERRSYTKQSEYLRGEGAYARDLNNLLDTLESCARSNKITGRLDDDYDNARVAWYRDHYDSIPLWVLFSDLTFGNLRYFFALMIGNEQREVCNLLRKVCGTTHERRTLTPQGMLADLDALSDLRNGCAHEERIYNGSFSKSKYGYPKIVKTLAAYLAEDDERIFMESVREVIARYAGTSPELQRVLDEAGLTKI